MRSWAYFATGLLFGLCLAIGFSGRAQTYIVVSGFAQHLSQGSHCNNHFTPGLGIEGKGYSFGVFDNSNCNVSAYVAKIWTPLHVSNWRLGAISGLVSGYNSSVIPVAGAVVAYERKTWAVNLIFVPPYKDSGNVLWVQAKWPF